MAFANKLKEIISQKGLKAVDLARATGLSEAAISDYLKGKKEPRGRQSISIAKALGVSLDTLWETGYQTDESPLNNPKLKQMSKIFQSLQPEFQDFALDFVKKLAELQNK